ncbi:MAG: DinB family protein [Rhodothermales bacterium]
MQQLSAAWQMGNEANLFLLNAIEERHLGDRYARKTRPVAAQFAHMHNVRLRWLTHAAPDLAAEVAQFPRGAELSKEDLIDALESSGAVMATYFDSCEEAGNVANWNGPPASFLAYIVAHEAHHRGLVMAALRACGHEQEEIIHGLWEWGR